MFDVLWNREGRSYYKFVNFIKIYKAMKGGYMKESSYFKYEVS